MLEGIIEVKQSLQRRNIPFHLKRPLSSRDTCTEDTVVDVCQQHGADMLFMDMAYLRVTKSWREKVVNRLTCPVVRVEDGVLVPVHVTAREARVLGSAKDLRRRQQPHLETFLRVTPPIENHTTPSHASTLKNATTHESPDSTGTKTIFNVADDADLDVESIDDIHRLFEAKNRVYNDVPPSTGFCGGTMQAKRHLARFLRDHLCGYSEYRNQPLAHCQSNLSPYLHFGHISVSFVVRAVKAHKKSSARDRYKFIDEIVTRRELAINMCMFDDNYDRLEGIPAWALDSLHEHEHYRKRKYSYDQLERGQTHDSLWNAAQHDLVLKGKMHGYLRMYWAKQIILWSACPKEALQNCLLLNDKFSLDGRDPNGSAY